MPLVHFDDEEQPSNSEDFAEDEKQEIQAPLKFEHKIVPSAPNLLDTQDEITFDINAFTILFIASWKAHKKSHRALKWYGLFVILAQFCILILILIVQLAVDGRGQSNQTRLMDSREREIPVVIAQAIAILLAVVSFDDVTVPLMMCLVVPNEIDVHCDHEEINQDVRRDRLRFFFWLALVFGLLLLVSNFVLILQSDTVLDILLKFAALRFVSEIGMIAFNLVKRGIIGVDAAIEVQKMEGIKITFQRENFKRTNTTLVACVIVLFALYVPWLVLKRPLRRETILKQSTCAHVQVSFGLGRGGSFLLRQGVFNETRSLTYHDFSGEYIANFDMLRSNRPTYIRNGPDQSTGMFHYCDDLRSWVFTVEGNLSNIVPERTKSNCGKYSEGWIMKSSPTDEVSVDRISNDEMWIMWSLMETVSLPLAIDCLDCRHDLDCGIDRGICNSKTRRCECFEYNTGPLCYNSSQGKLHYDQNYVWNELAPFLSRGHDRRRPCHELIHFSGSTNNATGRILAQVESVMVSDRPVFIANETRDSEYKVIVYANKRWYHTVVESKDFEVVNLSTYLDSFTESYSELTDSFLPTGSLNWYRGNRTFNDSSSVVNVMEISTRTEDRFECLSIDCSNPNACGPNGICQDNQLISVHGKWHSGLPLHCSEALEPALLYVCGGRCICDYGYDGHFCEIPTEKNDEF